MLKKTLNRLRIKARIRSTISGSAKRPRLAVFRSNTSIYAQLIDDAAGKTLAGTSSMKIAKGTKTEQAVAVGEEIATKAKELKIKEVVFDRGGFLYHGRVKALAEAARKGGLKF